MTPQYPVYPSPYPVKQRSSASTICWILAAVTVLLAIFVAISPAFKWFSMSAMGESEKLTLSGLSREMKDAGKPIHPGAGIGFLIALSAITSILVLIPKKGAAVVSVVTSLALMILGIILPAHYLGVLKDMFNTMMGDVGLGGYGELISGAFSIKGAGGYFICMIFSILVFVLCVVRCVLLWREKKQMPMPYPGGFCGTMSAMQKEMEYRRIQNDIAVKYCMNCGTKLAFDAQFCPNCGKQQNP